MVRWFLCACVAIGAGVAPTGASAQVLGTFTWQMQPFCNRVTLTLSSTPGGFVAAGTDDLCGAPKKAAATGFVVFHPDGTIGISMAIAAVAGVQVVDVAAVVSPANGQGTWSDSAGNSGTLVLGGATSGLPARPSAARPIDVADNPVGTDDPCLVSPPVELTLCGAAGSYWAHGGLGLPGLQVWKDETSRVHIRGSVVRRGAFLSGQRVFVLPATMRPTRTLAFSVGMSRASQNLGGRAQVLVYGPEVPALHGIVAVQFETDPADRALHFGEFVFSVDR